MLEGYTAYIVAGASTTLKIALSSLAVATVLGLVGAACRLASHPLLNRSAEAYSTLVRGVPDLVLMLLVFYGGQVAANSLLESLGLPAVDFDQFIAGVLTLGFIYGAYLSETFRGALLAVPRGQWEAGWAYGMSRPRVFLRVVLPQMIRLAIPGYTNNWLVLTKATALVSVIGLQDMMYRAREAGAATREPFTYLLVVGAVYLMITTVSLLLLRALERRTSAGVRMGEM
ncbi:ABC transporter permease [Crenobacter intestini]|uniref:ABC transporter permease subunit n=1 Tax=Crenobacter intestini TaxID=2563443 RepID=A0A4T0UMZ5_9NEIS|nr:ABC transporter permease subunit [Crenobacter intestini]TIC79841.1 ABC transporter permease subunit [Crenobacter intestini]